MHRQKLQANAAPVSNTCHAIRIAKILMMAAMELGGQVEHIEEYRQDIAKFTQAVEHHAWDEDSGYYGYVLHNDQGEAAGIMRHESGANFNMGLDGVYPLIAGISGHGRTRRMLQHFHAETELRSSIGLSTVGFDVWFRRKVFHTDLSSLKLEFMHLGSASADSIVVLVCMNVGYGLCSHIVRVKKTGGVFHLAKMDEYNATEKLAILEELQAGEDTRGEIADRYNIHVSTLVK